MERLECKAQNYAWGKVGLESKVAQLKASAEGDGAVDAAAPYAEYWFGTHPNGPSSIAGSGQLLSQFLKEHSDRCCDGDSLPFLFKVLSIAKALSIQAHPDKALAEKLHAERPDVYKDPNHKPEMAVALTPFEAMCGFRPLEEVAKHVQSVPELRAVVGDEVATAFVEKVTAAGASPASRDALPPLFAAYVRCPTTTVQEQLAALLARLRRGEGPEPEPLRELILRLADQFPEDPGALAPYFLNCVTLSPGQALFLAANEPHAYVSGDIVECMACSDNVVRAGLTPKLKDADTLLGMLTYSAGVPAVSAGARLDDHTTVYTPPVPEFEIESTRVPAGATYRPRAFAASSSILLVTQGGGRATARGASVEGGEQTVELSTGSIWLQPSSVVDVELEAAAGESELVLFRVHTNAAACAE